MRDDPSVVDLVERARNGEKAAWDAIVDRYAPLVWAVCRRYRLSGPDADDVGGGVWLRLVEHLDGIRQPAALPGWLAITTQRQCLHLLRTKSRQTPVDYQDLGDGSAPPSDDALLLEERRDALRLAFGSLEKGCQRLLSMLFNDPPTPYAEISSTLGVPVGAIGPTRKRCLERLRRSRTLAQLQDVASAEAERG